MFDFLFHSKRSAVKRFMSSRVNRSVLDQMRVGNRDVFRSAYCEVVWMVPCDDNARSLEFDKVYPAVTRDICPTGLSLILNEPLATKKVVVGIDSESGRTFFRCVPEHCTELGHGFYQIGLYLEEIIEVDPTDLDVAEKSVEQAAGEMATA